MKKNEVFVIGGGASGLVAAIAAARNHATVTIIEHNPKIAKKLLATGNGRCNYTNVLATSENYNHPDFVKPAFDVFGPEKTVEFFESLGIIPKTEDEGKTYPLSEQASSFYDVFSYEIQRLGINVILESSVVRLTKTKQGFLIFSTDGSKYEADKVIIATGGKALPKSGSDGSGYLLAESLNHTLTKIYPSLTKLKLNYPYLKQLDGVKIPGTVELIFNNESLQKESGDVLFTSYGISGPTILQLSRKAIDLHLQHQEVFIKVQLVTQLTKSEVKKILFYDSNRPLEIALAGIINKKFIPVLMKEVKIEPMTLISNIPLKAMMKLIDFLYDWRFEVIGYKGFEDAQVTVGGIRIEEINSMTMESKIHPGLFFCGEIIDIDALCGGYNLQWAWSSGYLAGQSASEDDEHAKN